jgi:hypothetical protein
MVFLGVVGTVHRDSFFTIILLLALLKVTAAISKVEVRAIESVVGAVEAKVVGDGEAVHSKVVVVVVDNTSPTPEDEVVGIRAVKTKAIGVRAIEDATRTTKVKVSAVDKVVGVGATKVSAVDKVVGVGAIKGTAKDVVVTAASPEEVETGQVIKVGLESTGLYGSKVAKSSGQAM